MSVLRDFSDGLATAVEKAAVSTVLVDARRRHPASGIAIAKDLVLTADHVVRRDSDIQVVDGKGVASAATIAGRDPGSDLLVLRLTDGTLVPASRASVPARVGQLALAVGRPARDGVQSSWGIITSINGPARTGRGGLLEKYLLSETTPYPGFSGGPLVDVEGGLLGLNTSGLTPGSALTIPVDVAWPIGEALAREGSVKRGYVGIRTQSVQVPGDENLEGLLVIWLEPGGPADSAGILVGDIVTGIGERRVESPDDIFVALSAGTVGKPVELNLIRGGEARKISVKVGERQ